METGDPSVAEVVDIVGQAFVRDDCPVAVAGVRSGEEGDFVEALTIDAGGNVTFDASASYDPNNRDDPDAIVGHRWTLEEAPQTFDGSLSPNPDVRSPSLFLDVPGRYVVALTVVDQMGNVSCETDEVVLTVRPDGGLRVVLRWETPGDPIPGDNRGGDLDLHVLHPNGRWDTSPWDCHWQNMSPNWGDINSAEDDPVLDRDSMSAGPEIFELALPEALAYTVGVHYGRDNGFGESRATVELYMGSALVFEAQKTLADPQFWEVARIDWSDLVLDEIDVITPDIP